jgi:hypothetical protein
VIISKIPLRINQREKNARQRKNIGEGRTLAAGRVGGGDERLGGGGAGGQAEEYRSERGVCWRLDVERRRRGTDSLAKRRGWRTKAKYCMQVMTHADSNATFEYFDLLTSTD